MKTPTVHELELKNNGDTVWMICPECLGDGLVGIPIVDETHPAGTNAAMNLFPCQVCSGRKVLLRQP